MLPARLSHNLPCPPAESRRSLAPTCRLVRGVCGSVTRELPLSTRMPARERTNPSTPRRCGAIAEPCRMQCRADRMPSRADRMRYRAVPDARRHILRRARWRASKARGERRQGPPIPKGRGRLLSSTLPQIQSVVDGAPSGGIGGRRCVELILQRATSPPGEGRAYDLLRIRVGQTPWCLSHTRPQAGERPCVPLRRMRARSRVAGRNPAFTLGWGWRPCPPDSPLPKYSRCTPGNPRQ